MRFSHGVTRLATHLYKTPVNIMCMLLKFDIGRVNFPQTQIARMSNGAAPSAKLCTLPQHPPLVSLIVLTCNRPGFLHLALELAAAQTYPNLEVVVVDDGTHAIQRSQLDSELR